jgi:hypothetical protein
MNKLIFITLGCLGIVTALLTIFFLLPGFYIGRVLRESNDLGQLREDFKIMLDVYNNTITLVTTSFAVIAFLITYQQKKNLPVSKRAWALISGSVICLTGALLLSLFGRELLVKMIEDNHVEFDLMALKYSRWTTYGCIILTAILAGLFFIDVAISPSTGQNAETALPDSQNE